MITTPEEVVEILERMHNDMLTRRQHLIADASVLTAKAEQVLYDADMLYGTICDIKRQIPQEGEPED